jgi:hypothetical protein
MEFVGHGRIMKVAASCDARSEVGANDALVVDVLLHPKTRADLSCASLL